MKPVLSRAQMREFDRAAIEDAHVPGVVLMENAGRGATQALLETFPDARRFLVCCGVGNNAGDGYVVARRLVTLGLSVRVVSLIDSAKLGGDAATNAAAWRGIGGSIDCADDESVRGLLGSACDVDVVVDAIFGTGLDRDVEGHFAQAIDALNESGTPIVALDVPSGLDADTGVVRGTCVRARLSVCFGHYKLGLFGTAAAELRGQVELTDIGVPPRSSELETGANGAVARLVGLNDVARWVQPRRADSHKGRAGHVKVLGGSAGKTGAAYLCAHAALRGGAGLCTVLSDPTTVAALDEKVVEVMTAPLDDTRLEQQLDEQCATAHSLAVGPGLGLDERARRIVEFVLQGTELPKVIDADAITLVAQEPSLVQRARGPVVLTPHPAELGRLLHKSAAEVEANRFAAVREAAELSGACVVLKGPHTLIASPDAALLINTSGCSALATAGAGDVLTGTIAALATTLPLREAAAAGVFLHGLAAELWAAQDFATALGDTPPRDRGLLAHEVADQLPNAFAELRLGE